MEPLSGVASVIAVVEISARLLNLCQKYCSAVKEARKDIQHFRNEVIALHDVLMNVQDLVDSSDGAQLSILDMPLKQCLSTLEELLTKLDPGEDENTMKQFGRRAWKWPFSSNDIKKAIAAIDRHKNTFNLALNADQTYSFLILLMYQKLIC